MFKLYFYIYFIVVYSVFFYQNQCKESFLHTTHPVTWYQVSISVHTQREVLRSDNLTLYILMTNITDVNMDNNSTSEDLFIFPSSLRLFFILLYLLTSLVAVSGNFLVIYLVLFRRTKTVTNMFIANLAFADVIIGMFVIPFQFQVRTFYFFLFFQ